MRRDGSGLFAKVAALLGAVALAGLAALAAGCGGGEEETPVACLDGPAAYVAALGDAPGAVRLNGAVPISACLVEAQPGGELASVGGSMVTAAARLNGEAREDPGGAANLRLGYLVGAAAEGAEGTEGIHADLVRRLEAAALYSPEGRALGARFLSTYRRGVEAGRRRG